MYLHPPPLLQAMNHPRTTLNELAAEEAGLSLREPKYHPRQALNSLEADQLGLETALSKLNETMGRVNTVQKEIQNVISEVQQHSGYIGSNTNPLSISNSLAGKYPPPSQILLQEGAQNENPTQMASRLASLVGKNNNNNNNNNVIQFDQQHEQDLLEHIIAPNDEQIGDILVKLASSTQIFPPSAAQAGANAIKSLFNSLMGSIESNIENENSNETNIKRLEIILFFLGSVVKNLHQPSSVILQIGSNKNDMNDEIKNPNPNQENTPSRRRNECNDEVYNTLTQQRQQAYHSYNDVLQICQQCFEEYTKTRPTKW
jgi:exonuclease VII small subunit